MNKIKVWLADPEHTVEEGLELYNEFGLNANLKRYYAMCEDKEMILSSLENELKVMVGESVLPGSIPKKGKEVLEAKNLKVIARQKKMDPFPHKKPEVLQPFYDKKLHLFIETRQLQARMVAIGDHRLNDKTKEERRIIAKQILESWDGINECWRQIDYYKEHGKLMEVTPEPEAPAIKADATDPMELDKRWRTLGTYISKAKKKKNQEALTTYMTERNAIAEILNKSGNKTYKLHKL